MNKLTSRIKGAAWTCLLLICACTVAVQTKATPTAVVPTTTASATAPPTTLTQLATPTGSAGAVYYVSRTGSNGDGRSWATAWDELDQIDWRVIRPGDTILVDGGPVACNFPVTVTDSTNTPSPAGCGMEYNTTLTIRASGEDGLPITIRLADQAGRNGTVRIFGGRSKPLPYCAQAGYDPGQEGNTTGIFLEDQAYIVIDGTKWSGIMIYGHDAFGIRLHHLGVNHHITIKNTEVFDNGTHDGEPNQEGVSFNGTDLTFEKMLVHDNGQDAFQTGYGTSAERVTWRRVWLYNQRPHPKKPNEPFNYCKHSDGIQIYGGGELHGLTVEDSIIGPAFMHGLILGDPNVSVTVHDVTLRNVLLVSHHGESSNAGLLALSASGHPTNYTIEHVTVVRDPNMDSSSLYIEGSGHRVENSLFYGGRLLKVDGDPIVAHNYRWGLTFDNGNLATQANPIFVDKDYAGVGPGFADFDFTITNPALPRGTGSSIVSVAQFLDSTPPKAWIDDLPSQSECANVWLSWDGSDPPPGSGIKSFDVQVSDNGGAWTNWLLETPARNDVYAGGAYSHTLGFQVRARDHADNLGTYSDAHYTWIIDTIPPYEAGMGALPQAQKPPFRVHWRGLDSCSPVTFDVEYRVGESPTWIPWPTATSDTHAMFDPESPQYGQSYYFRVRVQDEAGNSTESDPVSTILAKYTLSGDIVTIRHEPVIWTQVTVTDALAVEPYFGHYVDYLATEGDYNISVARYGFGTLPPMRLTSVVTSLSGLDLVLSPHDDVIDNGGFEATGWGNWLAGGTVTPTVVSGGHTGDRAALLGGTGGPAWLRQDLSTTEQLVDATLSFLVRLDDATAGASALTVDLDGTPISYTQVVSTADWTHAWLPVSATVGQVITLTFTVSNASAVRLDEVSLGSAIKGGSQMQLPVVLWSGAS